MPLHLGKCKIRYYMNFEIILILILWVVLAVVCTLVVYSVCTLTYTFDLLHRSLKTHNKIVILFYQLGDDCVNTFTIKKMLHLYISI